MAHFKMVCRGCGTMLSQCRCPSPDKTIEFGECARYPECRGLKVPAESKNLVTGKTYLDELTAEREALKATLADHERVHTVLRAENERLKAEVAELREMGIGGPNYCLDQLRELREAVKAVKALIEDDGRWTSASGNPLAPVTRAELRAVLAKVKR
jgi:hypothetical protein